MAQWAEHHGWYGAWVADHYMPNTGAEAVAGGPTNECWSYLAALAATTTTLRIGPLVSPTTVHHPALLANRAATIDGISDGRFVLGLGAGWQINEHRAYGIDLLEPGPRVTRFAEGIQIVRSLLHEERTTSTASTSTSPTPRAIRSRSATSRSLSVPPGHACWV